MRSMAKGSLAGKNVAIYTRFSSSNQREASIEDQSRVCSDHVVENGGQVDEELIFADMAISGASLARPAFERMMQMVESGEIDVVVTEDMSRISRDFADSADVFRRLRYLDVPLVGVSDGIDTSAQGAKLTFTMKALLADLYLDDLRAKTLRGLEGRALKGYSTGGLPTGYRSVPELGPHGEVIGNRIEIDEEMAAVVQRVFMDYRDGGSFTGIARKLQAEAVPPPRAKTRHRRKGWVPGTIRAWLYNETYVGKWTYKKRQWRKAPGSNARRPRERAAAEVMTFDRPELAIIERELWDAVQARLGEVKRHYTKGGNRSKATAMTRGSAYPLSGLMFCGVCGAPMTICGGSSTKYYGCVDAKKRGTCDNKMSLREDVARQRILGALRERLTSPKALKLLRKRIAEGLAKRSSAANAELDERRARLGRTEERIQGLITFIADGDSSDYVRRTLEGLEAHAKAEKAAIRALERSADKPIQLPRVDELVRRAMDLEAMVKANPLQGREALKGYFEDGRITLEPHEEGYYIARSRFFPLMLLSQSGTPRLSGPGRAPQSGCAGRI